VTHIGKHERVLSFGPAIIVVYALNIENETLRFPEGLDKSLLVVRGPRP
jgi:hypothetical protein